MHFVKFLWALGVMSFAVSAPISEDPIGFFGYNPEKLGLGKKDKYIAGPVRTPNPMQDQRLIRNRRYLPTMELNGTAFSQANSTSHRNKRQITLIPGNPATGTGPFVLIWIDYPEKDREPKLAEYENQLGANWAAEEHLSSMADDKTGVDLEQVLRYGVNATNLVPGQVETEKLPVTQYVMTRSKPIIEPNSVTPAPLKSTDFHVLVKSDDKGTLIGNLMDAIPDSLKDVITPEMRARLLTPPTLPLNLRVLLREKLVAMVNSTNKAVELGQAPITVMGTSGVLLTNITLDSFISSTPEKLNLPEVVTTAPVMATPGRMARSRDTDLNFVEATQSPQSVAEPPVIAPEIQIKLIGVDCTGWMAEQQLYCM